MSKTSEKNDPGSRTDAAEIDELIESNPALRAAAKERAVVLQAAQVLREAREAAGLSQRELADLAKTSQAHISELERGGGRHGPTIEILARLVAACGDRLVLTRAVSLARSAEIQDGLERLGANYDALVPRLAEVLDELEHLKASHDEVVRQVEQLQQLNATLHRASGAMYRESKGGALAPRKTAVRRFRIKQDIEREAIRDLLNYVHVIRSSHDVKLRVR